MNQQSVPYKGYAVSALLGAVGGGITVVVAMHAIPRTMGP
jgi:hypothetical protein